MNDETIAGIVYVLVNEAMPGYVKIGRTGNLKQRLSTLDNTSVPEPFECYYAAEVLDMHRAERILHDVFADFRSRPNKEFFVVDPDRVVAALQLAEHEDVTPRAEEYIEDPSDRERLKKTQRARFSFEMLGIPVGSTLTFVKDSTITCEVLNNRQVIPKGQDPTADSGLFGVFSLSGLTKVILSRTQASVGALQGGRFWTFEGELLTDRRDRLEAEK